MIKKSTVLSGIILLTISCSAINPPVNSASPLIQTQKESRWVLQYHPCYQWSRVPPEEVPWDRITHLTLGYLLLDQAGGEYTLKVPDNYYPGTDGWNSNVQSYISASQAGKTEKTQILCMLGGAGSNEGYIWNSATSAEHVSVFARNIKDKLVSLNFDGVDLDWEDNVDYPSLVRLASELRQIWPEAIITIPTHMNGQDAESLAAAQNDVDAFMPMTYIPVSQWGGWTLPAPLTPLFDQGNNKHSVDLVLNRWIEAGVPPEKIVMGIGGFGSAWGDSNGDRVAPNIPYANAEEVLFQQSALPQGERAAMYNDNVVSQAWVNQILSRNPLMAEGWDETGKCSYWAMPSVNAFAEATVYNQQVEISLIFYETPRSIRFKQDYVIQKGMKGMMFWTLAMMEDNETFPVLEALSP